MRQAGRGGVGGGAIAKIPKSITDRSAGVVGERHHQRPWAIGRSPGKVGHRDNPSHADQRVGCGTTVGRGKHHVVAERASADRCKPHRHVRRTESRRAKRCARHNAERAADSGGAVADGSAAGVGHGETCLRRGTGDQRSEIARRRGDSDTGRRQPCAADIVGRVAAVAGEDDRPVESSRRVGREGHGHNTGLTTADIVGGTAGDGKGRGTRGGATHGHVAGVDHREVQTVGLTDGHRAVGQAAGIDDQVRWIDYHNVVGAGLSIRSHRPGDREANRVGAGHAVRVREAGRGGVGGRTVAEIPKSITDRAAGVVGERHHQGPRAIGRSPGKAGHRDNRSGAADRVRGVAAVGRGQCHAVGERPGADRRKPHHHVSRPKSRHAEAGAGENGERTADSGGAVADRSAAGVGDHETDLRRGARDQRAEIVGCRGDGDAARAQSHAANRIGQIAAVAGEDNRVVECGRGRGSEGHGNGLGLTTGDVVGGATGDFERRGTGSRAAQGHVAGVDRGEVQIVGLANRDRSVVQAVRGDHQMRRISHHDVVRANLAVRAHRS